MADIKCVVASILKFLKKQLESNQVATEKRDIVDVAIQCLQVAFDVQPEDVSRGLDLMQLVQHQGSITAEAKAEADRLKNEGNELMKADKYREALETYTRAIAIDPGNAVYYCNRAAAHFKLGVHQAAVADCRTALGLQPDYSKAHGRLGLAFAAMGLHGEARDSFARASQLEPDNESYRGNIRHAEQRLASHVGPTPPVDLGSLLQNSELLNMATSMLADTNMQNLISGLMSGSGAGAGAAGPGGMAALLEAGQQLAQQMQAANPELVEQLRRQVRDAPPNTQATEPPQPPPKE